MTGALPPAPAWLGFATLGFLHPLAQHANFQPTAMASASAGPQADCRFE